jgi:hypothetical protein
MLKVFGYLFAGMIIATTAACSGPHHEVSPDAVGTKVRISQLIGDDFPCFSDVGQAEKYAEALNEGSGRAFEMGENAQKIHPFDEVQIIDIHVDKSSILKDKYTKISLPTGASPCWVPAIHGLFETP